MIRYVARSSGANSLNKCGSSCLRCFVSSCFTKNIGQQSNFLEDFIQNHKPEDEAIKYFQSKDWTRKILENRAYEAIPFYPRYSDKNTNENRFFAHVVNTPSTMEHVLALRRKDFRPSQQASGQQAPSAGDSNNISPELLCLMSLGTDLDSHPSITHGGFQAVMFDEMAWVCIMLHQNFTSQPGPREKNYTVSLETKFFGPVYTPSDVLFNARLVKQEGRKWWIQSDLMDESGKVLTSSESFWITAKRP